MGFIMSLWNNQSEINFFEQALESFATPEQLFYKLSSGYFAYIPKKVDSEEQTLQSRNSLIGRFTEKWCRDILDPIACEFGLFAVNGMICDELGLGKKTSADVAFCNTAEVTQRPDDVKIVFEVKMSIVSNYQYDPAERKLILKGDYKSHKGQPSLQRSDSMLKAIGKSVNIRVSGSASRKIPIIVLGNAPIAESYQSKVDFLKTAGIIQNFLSLNPTPTNSDYVNETPLKGFQTISQLDQLRQIISQAIHSDLNFFSSMVPKPQLGEFIRIAAQEKTDIERANKFLSLIYG